MNSVVKYRYIRQGITTVQEHISDGRAVRYRLYHVEGPGLVQDVVSRWTDTEYSGASGRINGKVLDAQSQAPIPNILVAAGGAQTFTSADGSFLLEGLPPGTHNLVAYSLDGAYRTYQQGAVVAPESMTPAPLSLIPAPLVNVVFTVIVPPGPYPAIPIRIAGNLQQLGNTFADLSGGVNTIAARMPVLTPLPDGRYTISFKLPAGADLRYKYTLGDGLWNAEHRSNGTFRVRQMIVPDADSQVTDQIETWQSGKSAPISFDVTVPSYTPPQEYVSIQFNPGFGWTEPMSMWPAGNNRWIYVLFSPLDILGTVQYRYCRNDQCGSADDARTAGPTATGPIVHTSLLPQMIVDPVTNWNWLEPSPGPLTIPNITVKPRDSSFMAGMEMLPVYHPSWKSRMTGAIADVKSLNANWIVFTPSWTFTRQNLPVLEPVPAKDVLYSDLIEHVRQARAKSLQVALFPTPNFPGGEDIWWEEAQTDFAWWSVWFESYRAFILNYADLAEREGVAALILGGDWLGPALPGGTLQDGSPSSIPEDAEVRWESLIGEVNQRYTGKLVWALPYPEAIQNPPPILDEVDQVYLLWSAPLAAQAGASEADLVIEAGRILDETVKPFQSKVGKPVILGISYPSAQGGLTGCLPKPKGQDSTGGCLDLDDLSRPKPDIPSVTLDLDEQVRAYSAMFIALNDRDWIAGIISRGFYPPALLEDKSTSIHGKPVSGVIWYWFKGFLNIGQ
jgi:hypothetical protein